MDLGGYDTKRNQTKKYKYMISCMYEMEGKEGGRKEGTKPSIHPYREQAGGCQRQGTGNRWNGWRQAKDTNSSYKINMS